MPTLPHAESRWLQTSRVRGATPARRFPVTRIAPHAPGLGVALSQWSRKGVGPVTCARAIDEEALSSTGPTSSSTRSAAARSAALTLTHTSWGKRAGGASIGTSMRGMGMVVHEAHCSKRSMDNPRRYSDMACGTAIMTLRGGTGLPLTTRASTTLRPRLRQRDVYQRHVWRRRAAMCVWHWKDKDGTEALRPNCAFHTLTLGMQWSFNGTLARTGVGKVTAVTANGGGLALSTGKAWCPGLGEAQWARRAPFGSVCIPRRMCLKERLFSWTRRCGWRPFSRQGARGTTTAGSGGWPAPPIDQVLIGITVLRMLLSMNMVTGQAQPERTARPRKLQGPSCRPRGLLLKVRRGNGQEQTRMHSTRRG